jgi:hypothetical protein
MNPNEKSQNIPPKFVCKKCDYFTSSKKDFNKHEQTIKHKTVENPNNSEIKNPENPTKIFKCECGRIYKHQSTLCKHKKTCTCKDINENVIKSADSFTSPDLLQLFLTQSKENQELKNLLIDQNKLFMEMCKNNLGINNTNNTNITNNNSHNKTFNLQFFLNEQCKDAMNIMDFVNSVSLQLSDLESVGKLGYVEGISNIMIKKLTEMDIYKRPVHCSDAKRETLYVKDNNIWEKENASHSKLRRAIKYISKKNSDLLIAWSNQHPASKNIHSKQNEEYMKMIYQAMGGVGDVEENENKIIKKISKMVLIEK